jgi:hypothetical protein
MIWRLAGVCGGLQVWRKRGWVKALLPSALRGDKAARHKLCAELTPFGSVVVPMYQEHTL